MIVLVWLSNVHSTKQRMTYAQCMLQALTNTTLQRLAAADPTAVRSGSSEYTKTLKKSVRHFPTIVKSDEDLDTHSGSDENKL